MRSEVSQGPSYWYSYLDRGGPLALNWAIFPSGDIWRCLETFELSSSGVVYAWPLLGRDPVAAKYPPVHRTAPHGTVTPPQVEMVPRLAGPIAGDAKDFGFHSESDGGCCAGK